MSQFRIFLLLYSIALFLLPRNVNSANITLSNTSSQTINDSNQQLDVNVQLTIDSSDGTIYYLRGVFYKEGSTKYCGYIYNGSDWFNGPYTTDEGWKKLPSIIIASGSGVLTLQSRFDPSNNNCAEVGDYRFKVQRYTQAGSATFDDQEPLTVNVLFSVPTPTTTPTKAPTLTKTPSPTKTPTATKSPSNKPTEKINSPTLTKPVTLTATLTSSPIKSVVSISDGARALIEVLGQEIVSSPSTMIVLPAQEKKSGTVSLTALLPFMVSGASCIVVAVYLSIRNIRRKSR